MAQRVHAAQPDEDVDIGGQEQPEGYPQTDEATALELVHNGIIAGG